MSKWYGAGMLAVGSLLALLAGCGDKPDPQLLHGEQVVKGTCFVCHGQGINNAPVIGNPRAWGPRAAQGEAVLLQHALEGYNMMPPRGGNPDLSDEDIRAAIRWMLSQLPEA